MSGFQFDQAPSPGTNRHAAPTDCPTCGGDRLIPISDDEHGAYARCPSCNASPDSARGPVSESENAWWKE